MTANRGADDRTNGGSANQPDSSARRGAGELSGLVLDILRHTGTALTSAAVRQRLTNAGAGALAYTTVVTILSRLHDRGLVERFRSGRAYAYLALDDSTLAARRMRQTLDDQDDRNAALASFVRDLSPGDEQWLRALLGAGQDAAPDAGHDPEPHPRNS